MKFIDFDDCKLSDRAGTYGGNAGFKDGILYNNEYWIVKYPKSMRGMRNPELSYTTSPLSEFLGSTIYKMLGFSTHETILGTRNNKLVVACKDFCEIEGSLREIRTLKNMANHEMMDKFEMGLESTSDHSTTLEEILLHLEYNPILSKVEGIYDRFWNMFVIDAFINNNDRNNGNWGVLYKDGIYSLAPIYGNGAAFSNKTGEEKAIRMNRDPKLLQQNLDTSSTAYSYQGKQLFVREIKDLPYAGFKNAIMRNVPIIQERIAEICDFIDEIPNELNGFMLISDERKLLYKNMLKIRLENLLKPIYGSIKAATIDTNSLNKINVF